MTFPVIVYDCVTISLSVHPDLKAFAVKVAEEDMLIAPVYNVLDFKGSLPSSVYLICASGVAHVILTF